MAIYTVDDTQEVEDVQEITPQVDTLLSTKRKKYLSDYARQFWEILQSEHSSDNTSNSHITPDLHIPDEDTLYATRFTIGAQNNNELKDSNIVTIHGQDYNKYDLEKSIKQVLSESSKYARWNHYSSAVSNDVWELYDALIDGSLEYTGRNFIDHRGRWGNEGKRIKDSSYNGGKGRGAAAYLLEQAIDRTDNYISPESTLLDFDEYSVYSDLAPIFTRELGLSGYNGYEMFLELDKLNKNTTIRSKRTVDALKKCIDNLNTILKKYNITDEQSELIRTRINKAVDAFDDGDANVEDLMLLQTLFGTAIDIKKAYQTDFSDTDEEPETPETPKTPETIAIRNKKELYTINDNLDADLNFEKWMRLNGYTGNTTDVKTLTIEDPYEFNEQFNNFENLIDGNDNYKTFVDKIVEYYFSSTEKKVKAAESSIGNLRLLLIGNENCTIKDDDELLKYILMYAIRNIKTELNEKFGASNTNQYLFSPNTYDGKMRILKIEKNKFVIQQAPLFNIEYAKSILRKVYDARDDINTLLKDQTIFWEKYTE